MIICKVKGLGGAQYKIKGIELKMFKHNNLNSRFIGSPADESCLRVDFEPDGFNLVLFRASDDPVVHRYHEPHRNAHQRGMELYQKEIGYRRRGGGLRGGH